MKIFLDANIIANWILLKNKSVNNVSSPILKERFRQLGNSFELVQEILKWKRKISITSQFVLAEIFGVLYDDAINMKLFREAIPTASWYWVSIRGKKTLSKDEAAEIYYSVMQRFDELFSDIEIVEDEFNLEYISHFILNLGLKPADSVLLTTAIENGATHFATTDIRLIELVKKDKKFDIVVQNPKLILDSLKKYKNDKGD